MLKLNAALLNFALATWAQVYSPLPMSDGVVLQREQSAHLRCDKPNEAVALTFDQPNVSVTAWVGKLLPAVS
ncbi:MAG: hypothetical protein ACRYG7_06015 [Janthinobacterium lividum]